MKPTRLPPPPVRERNPASADICARPLPPVFHSQATCPSDLLQDIYKASTVRPSVACDLDSSKHRVSPTSPHGEGTLGGY
ncbi:hypothetical protein MA16_Dca017014 [Dendrobium catenatum]|uniref:Uncharacterized protein n=1 Tax=Dendrobium catenatum TaxID=906689 RepID=A0A2I0XEX6_9ASPA|nr:hypothetical protein MA16_Dca017014 [Dendrobium catenatum]